MNTSSSFRPVFLAVSLVLAAAAAHAGTFQQEVAADPRGDVEVSNISGSIVISGWDKSAVAVTANVPGDSRRVKVTGGHGHTTVCVTYSDSHNCNSGGAGDQGPVDLEVHVPRGSELDVSGVSAGITSRSVVGDQHLHTVSGDIDAELGSGDDEAASVSGTIKLRGNGQEGTLHVTTVSGDLGVTNVAGELEARTVNGKLTAELSSARLVRLNTISGEIGLKARLTAGGRVETQTVSGGQKLELAAPAGYSYEAKTFSGDIDNCFGQQSDRSQYGPGNRLEGTRGRGDGTIRIQSMSGGVSLCDH